MDQDGLISYAPLISACGTLLVATVAMFTAAAARKSARAATESIELARRAMELGNRAYVSASAFDYVTGIATGAAPRIRVTLQNVGKTPTRHGRADFELALVEQEFGYAVRAPKIRNESFVIAPGLTTRFEMFLDTPLDNNQVQQLQDRHLFLYCWGRLTYEDIFGRPHETVWCISYDRRSSNQMGTHKTYNDMT